MFIMRKLSHVFNSIKHFFAAVRSDLNFYWQYLKGQNVRFFVQPFKQELLYIFVCYAKRDKESMSFVELCEYFMQSALEISTIYSELNIGATLNS